MCQLIDKPTRYRVNQEPSTLDLIMTKDVLDVGNIEYLPGLGASDHCVLKFKYHCYVLPDCARKSRPNYNKANFALMREQLTQDWDNLLHYDDVNKNVDVFIRELNNSIKICVPLSKPKVHGAGADPGFGRRGGQA